MSASESDALVFFGASGDLAFKKIFPALHAMVRRGALDAPVLGVGRSNWTADRLRAQARSSLKKAGDVDKGACEKLCALLCYVRVDYSDPGTFLALRKELGPSRRPAHYMAIPPQSVSDSRAVCQPIHAVAERRWASVRRSSEQRCGAERAASP